MTAELEPRTDLAGEAVPTSYATPDAPLDTAPENTPDLTSGNTGGAREGT